uniref:Retrovirus-related Pol polyprotein from transposon TNT 1-94-like beta-barrel domain-containing protein n=1 Tax=Brassica oleracea var. oleracea TaxID=109376 RepID=A0A0D3B802_BRAOL
MGCSVHMNPGRDLFIFLQEATFGKVRMANKSVPHVKGVASVRKWSTVENNQQIYHVHERRRQSLYSSGYPKSLLTYAGENSSVTSTNKDIDETQLWYNNVIRKTQRVKSAQAKHATKDKLDYIL